MAELCHAGALLSDADLYSAAQPELDVLESAESFTRYRERVTYLVPAGYVRLYDSLAGVLRQIRAMGHSIGCHGLNHTPLSIHLYIGPGWA